MDLKRYLDERREARLSEQQSPEAVLKSMDTHLSKLVDLGEDSIALQEDKPKSVMGEVTPARIKAAIKANVETNMAKEQVYAIAEFASDSKKSNVLIADQLLELNKTLRQANGHLALIDKALAPKTGPLKNSKEDTYRKAAPEVGTKGKDKSIIRRAAVPAVGGGGLLDMGMDLLSDLWPSRKKTVGEPSPKQTPKGKGGWFNKLASKVGLGGEAIASASEGSGAGLFKSLGSAVKGSALVASLFELPGLYDTLTSTDASVDKTKEVAKAGGRIAGVTGGALAGGAAGAALGSVVPVVGTAIGGLAGSVIGGITGSGAGEWVADKGTNAVRYAGGKLNDAGSWLGGKAYDAKEYVSGAASKGMAWAKENVSPTAALGAVAGAALPFLPMTKAVGDAISSAFKIDIIPAFGSAVGVFALSASTLGETIKSFFADFGKKAEEFLQDTKNTASYSVANIAGYANKVANKARDAVAGTVNKGAQALGMPKVMKTSIEKDILASGSALGAVSKKHESGGRGVEVISSGEGDHGGVSYGTYQLASNNGSMATFLKSQEGQKYAAQFQGLKPGTQEFNNAYKNVVGSDKAGFEAAQQAYISRTHYAPMAQNLKDNTGLDVSQRGRALQEQVFSTSVQYGANSKVLQKALGVLTPDQIKGMSDEQLTQKITDYKKSTVGQYFSKSSANVQANVAKRFEREQEDYKSILADSTLNKSTDRNKAYQDYIASRGGDTAENRKAWLATQQPTKGTVPATNVATKPEAVPAGKVATVPATNAAGAKVPEVSPIATGQVKPQPVSTTLTGKAEPVAVVKSSVPTDIKTVKITNTPDIQADRSQPEQTVVPPSSSTINGAQPTLAGIPMVIDDFGLQLLNIGLL